MNLNMAMAQSRQITLNSEHIQPDGELCEQCGERFKKIGNHWALGSNCTYPPFTEAQKEILCGLLMGDGSIDNRSYGNNSFILAMYEKSVPYLNYIKTEFKEKAKSVKRSKTAEESAEQNRKSGFNSKAKAKNYSDVYRLRFTRHPFFNKMYKRWYCPDKTFPEIEPTPRVLRAWYASDGTLNTHNKAPHLSYACGNESDSKEKFEKMFGKIGLSPKLRTHKRGNTKGYRAKLYFSTCESEKLVKYMLNGHKPQEVVPSFEYKFDPRCPAPNGGKREKCAWDDRSILNL